MLLNNKPPSVDISNSITKAEQVQAMFNRIAPTYSLLNDFISFRMHRSWKKFVAKQALANQGHSFLDLCTGPGDIAALISNASPKSKVIALDFAEEMLTIAKKNHAKSNIEFVQGDATQLSFENDSFDAVTVGYGLRNYSNLQRGLDEIYRVLKPGGRMVSLDLGKPEHPLFKPLYFLFFNKCVPLIGQIIHGKRDPYQYLPDSLTQYPSQSQLLDMLENTGFESIAYYNFAGGAAAVHVALKV